MGSYEEFLMRKFKAEIRRLLDKRGERNLFA